MKTTCFFMVCAYLSATVSAEEIKHLNRLKRVKSREEFVRKDGAAGRESSPTVESYPDLFARKFSSQVRVETFQKPKKFLPEVQLDSLQQQYHKRTGRPMKRLKTRSVAGISELSGNELISNLIPDGHDHGHGSIHIEPVFRVTTRPNNVFESIIDILRQLLDPPKNELGPLVGPVQVPGSGRKIYLRLLEPVDESHVMVRFVTQVQVPTADQEAKHGPIFSGPPVIDPAAMLLGGHHHSDVVFGSSTRHQHSVQPPRNASFARGKGRAKQAAQNSSKIPSKAPQDDTVAGGSSPVKEEGSKEAQKNQPPGGPRSNYHFETEEEALNQVNAILGEVNATAITESQEHQLTTHHLPLRQITPLYPLTSMAHAEPDANTYKVPNDVLTGPSSGSYEQYGDANSAPGYYGTSYDQHYSAPSSYASYNQQPDNVHSTPTTYATAATYQNEFHSYPISYQSQNEFGNSYSTSYEKQNDLYSAPSSYSASYEKPADVPPLSSTYATFHERPSSVPPAFSASHAAPHEKQNQGAQSGDALRIIDPPYFPDYPRELENRVNRSYDPAVIQRHQPRYNSHGLNGAGFAHGGESPPEKIVWGKSRGQKSETESGFPKNLSETSSENWQPVVFVHENAGWHDAFKAELAAKQRQSSDRPRKTSRNISTSSPEKGAADQYGKRRVSRFRSSWCTTGEEDGCQQAQSTTASTNQLIHLEKAIQVAEKTQAQEIADVKLTPATASKLPASSTTETSTLSVTSKSPTTSSTTSTTTSSTTTSSTTTSSTTTSSTTTSSTTTSSTTTSSTTKPPPPLVIITDATKTLPVASSLIGKPLPLVQTTRSPEVSSIGTTKKSIASETKSKFVIRVENKPIKPTKQPTVSSTTPAASSGNVRKLELPKRPMIMKKPMFIMKRMELSRAPKNPTASSTAKDATTSSTTAKSTTAKSTTRFSKFRSMHAKKPSTT